MFLPRDYVVNSFTVEANHHVIGGTDIHLLSPAAVAYPVKVREYASRPVPSLRDWQELWAAWDTVTRAMTPQEELLSKPIKLRNALIFYHGHIPGFAGMLVGQPQSLSNSDRHQIYRLQDLLVKSQPSQQHMQPSLSVGSTLMLIIQNCVTTTARSLMCGLL